MRPTRAVLEAIARAEAEGRVVEGTVAPDGALAPRDEAELLAAIVSLASRHGWLCHHSRPARTAKGWRTPITGDPGLPDLILCGHGRLIIPELKGEKGRPTRSQRRWLAELAAAGADVRLWRPRDWGEIERLLRGDTP